MTIICAMHDPLDGGTWIGSDTMGNSGHLLLPSDKWSLGKKWAVGTAGYWRGANVVEQSLDDWGDAKTAWEIGEIIRGVFKEYDFVPDGGKGEPPGYGHSFIFASATEVWNVGVDFGLTRMEGIVADGSGRELAYGAAWHRSLPVETIINLAVSCAIHWSRDSSGEPWVHKIEP